LDELQDAPVGSESSESKTKPIVEVKEPPPVADKNFTLLDPGESFEGYTILKMLNKDKEGIKYIAKKDDKEYILKIFYHSSFQNMHTLFDLQMRLSRLNHLEAEGIAKVKEIKHHRNPAFMAVEYVHGSSLAEIKRYNPDRLDEALVRKIMPQLIKAAKAVRKHGLTLSELSLNGIMLSDNDSTTILSSGIVYRDVDEREDLFTLGMLCAQLLSRNPRYHIVYSDEMLRRNKFAYIGGVSLALNKIMADCLHRNIGQRYKSLDKLEQACRDLPDLKNAPVSEAVSTVLPDESKISEIVLPKFRIEYGFWALVLAVVLLLAAIFGTGLYDVIFGPEEEHQHSISTVWAPDTLDTQSPMPDEAPPSREQNALLTPYGELRSTPASQRQDPRRLPPPTQTTDADPAPIARSSEPPANFVYIQPSTFGFGRLGEEHAHNVSLSGYYISKYEVTQADWNRFMKPARVSAIGDNLPVDNVSWYDIAIFCNGLSEAEGLMPAYRIRGIGEARVVTCDFDANGYRLPTEAEWELAAKAEKFFIYSGSDDPAEVAWYRDNSAGKLRSPGGKDANAFGIHDMTGNVSEWVWDWHDANYIRSLSRFVNPTGPQNGSQKVIRGGNVMNSDGRNLHLMWRERGDPNRGYPFVGFLLVRTH
jgi:formylglycine-generating enzyme required for sulfatase activity